LALVDSDASTERFLPSHAAETTSRCSDGSSSSRKVLVLGFWRRSNEEKNMSAMRRRRRRERRTKGKTNDWGKGRDILDELIREGRRRLERGWVDGSSRGRRDLPSLRGASSSVSRPSTRRCCYGGNVAKTEEEGRGTSRRSEGRMIERGAVELETKSYLLLGRDSS